VLAKDQRLEKIILNNHSQDKLPGILRIYLKYIEGESMFMNLDLRERRKE